MTDARNSARLARLTLVFAILYALFIIAPTFLDRQFSHYPLMKWGDVLDLATPLVLIPLYWLLFRVRSDSPPGGPETLAFLVMAALWAAGQGMHLAANSIGHLTRALPPDSNIETLTRFYDERLGHWLWHIGMVGLSALLIHRQWRNPFAGQRTVGAEAVAGVVYGFTYFVAIVEGRTAPLGVPFALAVVAFALVWGRHRLRRHPLLAFFFVGYSVAALLFLTWGLRWGGLPEFSEVGIIE